MEKYLHHLHSDIEAAIEQAPPPAEYDWLATGEEEDFDLPIKQIRLCELFGILPEAFPPENMLSDRQVEELNDAIALLWSSWKLFWELPLVLPERKKYTAMVKVMECYPVSWSPGYGGEIVICRRGDDQPCPFGPGEDYCFCKYLDQSVRHEAASWNYDNFNKKPGTQQELSPEEEAAFEHEMMILELQRMYGDDWERFADADLLSGNDFDRSDGYFFSEDFDDEEFGETSWPEEDGEDDLDDFLSSADDEDDFPDDEPGPRKDDGPFGLFDEF